MFRFGLGDCPDIGCLVHTLAGAIMVPGPCHRPSSSGVNNYPLHGVYNPLLGPLFYYINT